MGGVRSLSSRPRRPSLSAAVRSAAIPHSLLAAAAVHTFAPSQFAHLLFAAAAVGTFAPPHFAHSLFAAVLFALRPSPPRRPSLPAAVGAAAVRTIALRSRAVRTFAPLQFAHSLAAVVLFALRPSQPSLAPALVCLCSTPPMVTERGSRSGSTA